MAPSDLKRSPLLFLKRAKKCHHQVAVGHGTCFQLDNQNLDTEIVEPSVLQYGSNITWQPKRTAPSECA